MIVERSTLGVAVRLTSKALTHGSLQAITGQTSFVRRSNWVLARLPSYSPKPPLAYHSSQINYRPIQVPWVRRSTLSATPCADAQQRVAADSRRRCGPRFARLLTLAPAAERWYVGRTGPRD